jgi:hypothetical protein
MIQSFLQQQLPAIRESLEKHKIKTAYVFGSVCSNNFNEKSDIDFLVSFQKGLDPIDQGEHWWSLLFELEDILHRDVDLLNESSLHNPYFLQSVNKNKQLIYEVGGK